MPKTRNISRTQWEAANSAIAASHSSTITSRTRRNNRNSAQEDEKENAGRSTTQTRTHRIVFGGTASSSLAATTKAVTRASKAKPAQKKEKKLPLQDITSQFLPAPESANRGAELVDVGHRGTTPPPLGAGSPPRQKVASPLPPSSPPSELMSPIQLKEHPVFDDWFEGTQHDHHPDAYGDPAHELGGNDHEQHSSSDPFGFNAVELKLKQERELAAAIFKVHEEEEEDYEDLHNILVADTSSPRPQGLTRSRSTLHQDPPPSEAENHKEEDEPPAALSRIHLVTPPTPLKDKAKHPRLSHPHHHLFSPCASSSAVLSSPSPTKTSATKRPRQEPQQIQTDHDPREEFNEEFEKSVDDPDDVGVDGLPPPKRQCHARDIASDDDDEEQQQPQEDAVLRNLRPRRQKPVVVQEFADGPQTRKKPSSTKDKSKKPASKASSSKKVFDDDNDDNNEMKCQQEREARIKYFERLTDYEVEKEDVYII